MIRSTWRRFVAFLGSAGLATVLLAILGVWSILASAVPQGTPATKEVAEWAGTHAALWPVVRAVGLNRAFSNPLFILLVAVLGVSTAICAWQRTKVAAHRARTLRKAAQTDHQSLVERHDFEVVTGSVSDSEALAVATETLHHLGVKTKEHDGVLTAVSPRWTVWGSPIFHWALLGILLTILVGTMLRAEGLMGVAVGETKPDAPASYGKYTAGLLHNSRIVPRSVRVDAFEPDYKTGGVDRGPTPTVTVFNRAGAVVKSQRVYPNHTLKAGALTIYPSSYGLAAKVQIVKADGTIAGQGVQLIDFSPEVSGGTAPAGWVDVPDSSGATVYRAAFTVPLDHSNSGWINQVPRDASARIVVTALNGGTVVLDSTLRPGETLALPGAQSVHLDSIVYYARLKVVDDWTVTLLYAGLIVALGGLSIATLARQQIVLVGVSEGSGQPRLVAKVRLWRNASTTRDEIESELVQRLTGTEKGSMS